MNKSTFEFPCSIGDKVYILSPNKKFFYEAIVSQFEIISGWGSNKPFITIHFENYTEEYPYMDLKEFNKKIKQGFIFQSLKDVRKIIAQEKTKERNKMIKIDGKEYQEIYFVWEGMIDHSRKNKKEYFEGVSCIGIFSTKEKAIEGMKKAYSYFKEDNNNIVSELKESQKETAYGNEKENPYSFHTFGFEIKYKEGIYDYSECGYSIEKTCLNKLNIFDIDPKNT